MNILAILSLLQVVHLAAPIRQDGVLPDKPTPEIVPADRDKRGGDADRTRGSERMITTKPSVEVDKVRDSAHKNKHNVEAPKIKRLAAHNKPEVDVDRTGGMSYNKDPGADAVKINSEAVDESGAELDRTGGSAKESMSQPNGKLERTRVSDPVSVAKSSSEVDRTRGLGRNRGAEFDIVDTSGSKNTKTPNMEEVRISSAQTNKRAEMHRKRDSADRNNPSVEVVGTNPIKSDGDWVEPSGLAEVKKSGIDRNRGNSSEGQLGQGVLSDGTNSNLGSPNNIRKSADENGQGIDHIQSFSGDSNMRNFLQNRRRPTNTFGNLPDGNQSDVLPDRRPINGFGGSADSNKPRFLIRRRPTNLFGSTAFSNARNNFSNTKPTHFFGSSVDGYRPGAPSNRWRPWTPTKDFNVESSLGKTPGFGTRPPHYFGSSADSNQEDAFPSGPTQHFPNSSPDSYKTGFLSNIRRPRQHFNEDLAEGYQNDVLANTRPYHSEPGSNDRFSAFGKEPGLNRPRRTHFSTDMNNPYHPIRPRPTNDFAGSIENNQHNVFPYRKRPSQLFGSMVNRNRPADLLDTTRPSDNFNGLIYGGKPVDVPNTRKPFHHTFSEGSTYNNKPSDLPDRTGPTHSFLRDSNDWSKNEDISDRIRPKQFRRASKSKPYNGVVPDVTGPMNNADGNKPGVQGDVTKSPPEIRTNLPSVQMDERRRGDAANTKIPGDNVDKLGSLDGASAKIPGVQ